MEDLIEIFLRGLVEKLVDQLTEEEHVNPLVSMMKALKPAVISVEDAVFGHILGDISGRLRSTFSSVYKREPTSTEIEMLAETIIRRSMEIRAKVREIANK